MTREPSLREQLDACDARDDRLDLLTEALNRWAVSVLDPVSGDLDPATPLLQMGLDSLGALELHQNLESRLGCRLPLAAFLRGDSPRDLAEVGLKALERGLSITATLAQTSESQSTGTPFPLSYNQRALWYLYKLAPDSSAYHICFAAVIHSSMDPERLRTALHMLGRRHDMLRVAFAVKEEEPWQRITREGSLDYHVIDASSWSESSLQDYLVSEAHHPFDLEHQSPYRVRLLKRAEDRYVLLFTAHRIAADFRSFWVLMDELNRVYQWGDDALPDAPTFQYADFVAFQRREMDGVRGSEHWDWWRRKLAGDLPALGLALDKPRPKLQTFNGRALPFKFTEAVSRGVRRLAHESGSTLYTVLLAAFKTLLHRYTGREDLLLGSPTTGRTRAEFRDVVGYFANPIVLRTSATGRPGFRVFLDRVRAGVMEALAHADFPFPLLVERLRPDRSPNQSPIFQALFAVERPYRLHQAAAFANVESGARIELGDLSLESEYIPPRGAWFDLALTITDPGERSGNGRLSAHFRYNSDLFEAATMERMGWHFQNLVAGIVANAQCRIDMLPLMGEDERTRVLQAWNDTALEFPLHGNLARLFERQVLRSPDALALKFGDVSLTYREVDAHANVIARRLLKAGVTTETVVGVLAKHGPLPLIGMLGVLKAGGVCLFLGLERPGDQFNHMLQDANLHYVLAADPDAAPGDRRQVIPLALGRSLTPRDWVSPNRGVLLANAAVLNYSFDGSEGPRASVITHGNLINNAYTCCNHDQLAPEDRLLYHGPVGYRMVADAVFQTWLIGAALILRPPGGAPSLPSLIHFIDTEHGTALVAPTAVWSDWVARLAAGELTLPKGLRLVVAGRDRVFPERLEQWREDAGPLLSWLNLYAMDEMTGSAAIFHDRGAPLAENLAVIPLGRPVENTRAYILNRSGDPVPAGVPGELFLSGLGLARGYQNRGDLTALRFVPDPFSDQPGGRLFRTGDQVRYLPNGSIAFLGRMQDQVPVRGLHLLHTEIESVIDGLMVGRRKARDDRSTPQYHEQQILEAWCDLLGRDDLNVHDDFFEAGGNSLLLVRALNRLKGLFDLEIPLSAMLRYPTVHTLADYLKTRMAGRFAAESTQHPGRGDRRRHDDIAVIGMACRFPGAPDLDAFHTMLKAGRSCFESGEKGQFTTTLADFDAAFFGMSEQEAAIADPQLRLFLETAWHAMEHAGLAPGADCPRVGVFAAADPSAYLIQHLLADKGLVANLGVARLLAANCGDGIAAQTAFRFNLNGPAHMVQCGRTSALAAVHRACEAIVAGECDAAIAGAVSIPLTTDQAVAFEPGCGAVFDAAGAPAPPLGGVGVVVLKRLVDTQPAGAHVLAVIKGSAVNHDGGAKTDFNAVDVRGVQAVVQEALEADALAPETIAAVESACFGESTADAAEVCALNRAFQRDAGRGSRRLGAVSANIGDAGAAAGMAALIKTVLALVHAERYANPGFHQPHPHLEFESGPFHVQKQYESWDRLENAVLLRAGVSAVSPHGNAFVVLQEPPRPASWYLDEHPQLLTLSAADPRALNTQSDQLARYLETHPNARLCDVGYTLQVGRASLPYRRMWVASDVGEAAKRLRAAEKGVVLDRHTPADGRPVLFMFPGQGAQYAGMGMELYRHEPVFRELIDNCSEYLKPLIGVDLRRVLFPPNAQVAQAEDQLAVTLITQCAVFVVNYACARLWMSRGVVPRAMIGHSIGEYTAACLADVLSLEDTLSLVVDRGLLMREAPAGAMMSVALAEDQLTPYLSERLSLAAVNESASCVVSGPVRQIDELAQRLGAEGVLCKRLKVSHAFHSKMQDPFLPLFRKKVATLPFSRPKIPYISGVTGDWITAEQATDPEYWVQHLRRTVRFHQGLTTFLKIPDALLLEVGPGRSLSFLVRRHLEKHSERVLMDSMSRKPFELDESVSLQTLGKLWLHGVPVFWDGVHHEKERRRLPLPLYPFQSTRHWVARKE